MFVQEIVLEMDDAHLRKYGRNETVVRIEYLCDTGNKCLAKLVLSDTDGRHVSLRLDKDMCSDLAEILLEISDVG